MILSRKEGDAMSEQAITNIAIVESYNLLSMPPHLTADRQRITSDLDSLHRALVGWAWHSQDSLLLAAGLWCRCGNDEPCPDATRYSEFAQAASDSLKRTAALYGVTP